MCCQAEIKCNFLRCLWKGSSFGCCCFIQWRWVKRLRMEWVCKKNIIFLGPHVSPIPNDHTISHTKFRPTFGHFNMQLLFVRSLSLHWNINEIKKFIYPYLCVTVWGGELESDFLHFCRKYDEAMSVSMFYFDLCRKVRIYGK